MSLIFSFLSLAISLEFSKSVKLLPDLPPDDGTPYMVMLHSDGCSHCVRLAPTWSATAELGEGVCTWAALDCGENQTACRLLQTEGLPRILYFLNGKVFEYQGMQISRMLVNWASNFLNDTAILVSKDNFTEQDTEKAAILFTDKDPAPKVWAAIENLAKPHGIKFYYSHDKELLKELGLEHYPGVYLKKGKDIRYFPKKLTAKDAKEFIDEYFGKGEL